MLTKPSHNKFLSCASRLVVLSWVSAFTLLLLLGLASPAKAAVTETQVAVATATNLKAIGKPPISPARELKTGVGVFFSEKVSTNKVGRAQLLFEDGTALTVGPTSDLVIDEYVYDPKAGTGAMTVSISKGFFRLVGGKISKKTPIKFLAPNATVGVRGGIVLLELSEDGVLTADLLYGDELTVTSGGKTQRTTQAGRFISVMGANAIPLPSQQRSSIDLTRLVGAFERNTATLGATDNLLTATEKKQQTAEARQEAQAEHQAAQQAVKEARDERKTTMKAVGTMKEQLKQAAEQLQEAKSDLQVSRESLEDARARIEAAEMIAGPEGEVERRAARRALRQARQANRTNKQNLADARRERATAKQAKHQAVDQRATSKAALQTARIERTEARRALQTARREDKTARQELRAATRRIRVLGTGRVDSTGSATALTIDTTAEGSTTSGLEATRNEGHLSTKGDSGTGAPISVTIDPVTGEASIRCGAAGGCDSVIEVGSSEGSTTVLVITKLTKAEKKEAKAEKQEAKAEKKKAKAEKQEAKAEKKAEKKEAKKAEKAEEKAAESESEECDAEVSECETRLPAGVVALWTWSVDGGARIETTVSGRLIGSLPKLTRRPCTECRFLAWGRETVTDTTTDSSSLRYWLAGAAATATQLAGAADKNATYSGAMVGGVLRGGSIIERRGSFDARVRFGTTHYQVNAFDASFDGGRFRGASAHTGNAAPFSVKSTSTSWAHDTEKTHTLRASGYFFGRGASAGDTPSEMGGHFRITGDRYQAGGVFAGRKR